MTRSMSMAAFLLAELGCSAAQQAQSELADPCSKLSWTTVEVGCEHRIETECEAGDKTCPVYVECSRARAEWQKCE